MDSDATEAPLTDHELTRLHALAEQWMEPGATSGEFALGLMLDQLLDEHAELKQSGSA